MTLLPNSHQKGSTLTEVMLAMAVVAITVPLTLGLVLAGGEGSRLAEQETRAVMTSRSVFEELRRAQNNNSAFIDVADLPWGTGNLLNVTGGLAGGGSIGGNLDTRTGDAEWLILELNKEGEIIGLASDMLYDDRWDGRNNEVTALAAVRGYSQEIEDVEVVAGEPLMVFRIEVRVETPARAEAEDRRRTVFIKSDSLR